MSESAEPRSERNVELIIACGCLIAVLSFGPRSAMGLFQAPMLAANDWTRETFGLALAIQNLVWGAVQPFAGMIADKFGSSRVLTLGAFVYAAGLVLMANADTAVMLHLSAGVLVGVGIAMSSFALVIATFGRRLPKEKQSFAFGLGTAAGSFGQFLFAPLGAELINRFGWQNALVVMGVMMLAIPVLAVALRSGPQPGASAAAAEMSMARTIGQAFGHRSYVLLVSGFFVCGFQVAFITAHFPAFLADQGLSVRIGGIALALIGLFNIVGSITSGWIGGRYRKAPSLAIIYLLRAIVVAVYIALPITPASTIVFAAVMGLLWLSTVPLTSGLVAVMFGPRYMATLFGFVFFSHQIGSFLGVWLGGLLYDRTGSYDVVWWLSVVLGLFAAVIHLPIREKPAPALAPA